MIVAVVDAEVEATLAIELLILTTLVANGAPVRRPLLCHQKDGTRFDFCYNFDSLF